MGIDKASLPFGDGTMLERVLRTVESVIMPRSMVLVAAVNQELPTRHLTVVRDSSEYQGPLAAIANGLEVLANRGDAVFVTGCDTPLLSASVIRFLFDRLANFDCIVPRDAERLYPLCAVYRTSILAKLQAFSGRSLHEFIASLNAYLISCDELRAVDPDLNSLLNVNTQADYEAALAVAGFSTP